MIFISKKLKPVYIVIVGLIFIPQLSFSQLIPFSMLNKSPGPSMSFPVTFSSSSTWTVPASGCTQLTVKIWGGGGGAGGTSYLSPDLKGGAGGSGGFLTATITVSANDNLNINIGSGGLGGESVGGIGGSGGTSSLGNGGNGGTPGPAAGSYASAGGGGGAPSSIYNVSSSSLIAMASGGGGGGGAYQNVSLGDAGGSADGGVALNNNGACGVQVEYCSTLGSNGVSYNGGNGGSLGNHISYAYSGGGGGGGGYSPGRGGNSGNAWNQPKSGGGNAGTNFSGTSSVNSTHGNGGATSLVIGPGGNGQNGYIELTSCL